MLYQRTRAEVLRGDISFHLQSAPQLKDTSAIYLPQQRENSCEQRENISMWVCEERESYCLKVLLDDWSSAVVKNRLLQQLLHRLLSLACSASPLSQSLSLTHTHTHDTACFQPTASSVASFPFSSLSLR